MKGILKGLRYIQDMFDEKEQEMQIGNPTDVKHVAHIGMDGPSASKPSWMSEYNSAQELSSDTLANDLQDGDLEDYLVEVYFADSDTKGDDGNQESLPPTEKQKKPRRKVSIENGHGAAIESPKGSENGEKQRRPRSSNQDPSSQGRRHSIRKTDGESPSNDLPDIPKKSRRKKSKGSAGGSEGESSSRSKPGSLPDVAELES